MRSGRTRTAPFRRASPVGAQPRAPRGTGCASPPSRFVSRPSPLTPRPAPRTRTAALSPQDGSPARSAAGSGRRAARTGPTTAGRARTDRPPRGRVLLGVVGGSHRASSDGQQQPGGDVLQARTPRGSRPAGQAADDKRVQLNRMRRARNGARSIARSTRGSRTSGSKRALRVELTVVARPRRRSRSAGMSRSAGASYSCPAGKADQRGEAGTPDGRIARPMPMKDRDRAPAPCPDTRRCILLCVAARPAACRPSAALRVGARRRFHQGVQSRRDEPCGQHPRSSFIIASADTASLQSSAPAPGRIIWAAAAAPPRRVSRSASRATGRAGARLRVGVSDARVYEQLARSDGSPPVVAAGRLLDGRSLAVRRLEVQPILPARSDLPWRLES